MQILLPSTTESGVDKQQDIILINLFKVCISALKCVVVFF